MRLHGSQILIITISILFLQGCQGIVDFSLEQEADPAEGIISYSRIMLLGQLSPSPQGGDCWGDLFFQFVSGNTHVRIYNLSSGELIQVVSIPFSQQGFVPSCHCNTVCFGSEYYQEDDEFPLIYVSTGYGVNGYTGALVYRINENAGKFNFTLVQVLRFPVDNSTWTEFIPAGDYAYLCYTAARIIYKVPMPKREEGDIIISRDNAVETYQFTPQPEWMFSSRNQDRLFYNGKILYVSGVPQSGEASVLVVLNLENRVREAIVDFKINGLYSEPESIFCWRDNLCCD